MYNFYQSSIRKTINKDVYRKPTLDVVLFWTTYQAIVWEKRRFWITLAWVQILWINNNKLQNIQHVREELSKQCSHTNPIFIQIGDTTIVGEINDKHTPDKERDIVRNKLLAHKKTRSTEWYINSNKENLPPSTYILDINKTLETLQKHLSTQHRNRIKKAERNNVSCSIATGKQEEDFFNLLEKTWYNKGFGAIPHKRFTALIRRLRQNKTGDLYIATHNDKLVAGAIYLIDKEREQAVYLYWASDRETGNLWASHYLHRNCIEEFKKKWIKNIDFLWWGEPGNQHHRLYNVGLFKEWFGAKQVVFWWSYDIVYRPFLYKIWRRLAH